MGFSLSSQRRGKQQWAEMKTSYGQQQPGCEIEEARIEWRNVG